MQKITMLNSKSKQGILPLFISDFLDIDDMVFTSNKYSWVWRKATEKSRYRLFAKVTALFEEMNETLRPLGVQITTKEEYVPEELRGILARYAAYIGSSPRFNRAQSLQNA